MLGMPFILRRWSFGANESLLIERCCSISYWWGILIGHRETLFRTDFHTKIADATFKAVDLPFFAFFGDLGYHNGVGWAPLAANPAKNAFLDINFYAPPGNRGINSFSFRVHEGCGPFDQVLGHGFCHGE